ncbi:MAG: serine/threonine-protein kinase [Myxococcota bacterium]
MSEHVDKSGALEPDQPDAEPLQQELESVARSERPAASEKPAADDAAINEATQFDLRLTQNAVEHIRPRERSVSDIQYVDPGFYQTDELSVGASKDQERIADVVHEMDPALKEDRPPPADGAQTVEVGQCFARGGMAELYHARRLGGANHKKRFVMKKLLKELQLDQVYIDRFRHEARVTAGLKHPHLIETYEFGQHKGQYYIAMEYLPGRDLSNVLDRLHHFGIQCPVEIVLEVALACSKALGHVHEMRIIDETGARIVHRDVNPANVMITWDGRIKLLDFGLAKDPTADLTGGGEMVGKLMYQPPEAVRGEKPAPKWDVYSVGLLMFELLSGRAPYGGLLSSSQLMAKIVSEELDDIQSLNGTVPDSVAAVVTKATAKDPAERFESMSEMVAALEEIINTEIGGRGDVKTFMRILYQEDQQKAATRRKRPAASKRIEPRPVRRDRQPGESPKALESVPSRGRKVEMHRPRQLEGQPPKDKAELQEEAARLERRKTMILVLVGISVLGLVAGSFYVFLASRRQLGIEDLDPRQFIETGVSVRCDQGLVYLDGIEMGRCPSASSQTSVGRYKLEIVNGNQRIERTVDVGEGQLINVDTRGE